MPRYLVERDFGRIDDAQFEELGQRSVALMDERFPDVTWEHSHICGDDDGSIRSFCVYQAPDSELVREHAQLLGDHAIVRVFEIAGDVTPDDLRR
jgi:hypothetical protein